MNTVGYVFRVDFNTRVPAILLCLILILEEGCIIGRETVLAVLGIMEISWTQKDSFGAINLVSVLLSVTVLDNTNNASDSYYNQSTLVAEFSSNVFYCSYQLHCFILKQKPLLGVAGSALILDDTYSTEYM